MKNRRPAPGFGIVEGIFSFLILSADAERKILAYAPLKPVKGSHWTQSNGLRPIRIALGLLFPVTKQNVFKTDTPVQFEVGKFVIESGDFGKTMTQYNGRLSRFFNLAGKPLPSTAVINCYVKLEDGSIVDVGINNRHTFDRNGLAAKYNSPHL